MYNIIKAIISVLGIRRVYCCHIIIKMFKNFKYVIMMKKKAFNIIMNAMVTK